MTAQKGFQQSVKIQPAPAQAGDFFGTNPRAIAIAGPGQFVSPAKPNPVVPALQGVTVGNIIWANTDTGDVSQTFISGYTIGILHREMQAIIVSFLAESVQVVVQGLPITLFAQGDFWGKFAAGAAPGSAVYADPATGNLIAIAPGASTVVKNLTGSVTTGVLTVTAASGLPLGPGDVVVGTGITAGNQITAQLTSTAAGGALGSTGTYQLAIADTGVVSEAITVSAIATPWNVCGVAGNGELAPITTWGS